MRKGLVFLTGLLVALGFAQSTRVVDVAPNYQMIFCDTYSGTEITVYRLGR